MTNPHLRQFTSESVTEGHPDKICDQISDAVLDAIIDEDPDAKVAVETMVTTGLVHVAGEIRTRAYADIAGIVRKTITEIGYDSSEKGFDGHSCGVSVSVGEQSADIASGVTNSYERRTGSHADDDFDTSLGAGDQGLMFGYADSSTEVLMPLPIHLAHRLSERLTEVRKSGVMSELRPDGKTQVTIGYDGEDAVSVEAVVLSTQHGPEFREDQGALREALHANVIDPVLADLELDTAGTQYFINPAGPFIVGGPMGDAGLTGRKIIVDTYGGYARHGGGAFSGKDPSKVDRSAAYAMRWVAKTIVAAGLAERAEVQVAYAIGRAEPVGLYVETFGTEKVAPDSIAAAVREMFNLRPAAIIRDLQLQRPIYRPTAAYGHFGRTGPGFTWESTVRAEELARLVS